MIIRHTLAVALLTALAGGAAPYDAHAAVEVGGFNVPAATKAIERVPFYVRHARGRNSEVERELRGNGGEITYYLDSVETFVVNLPEPAAAALANNPHVALVELVPEHKIAAQTVPWNIDQFQARDVWDKNRDGAVDVGAADGSGVKFCIIDTGFFYDIDGAGPDTGHSDFVGITASGISQITGEQWHFDGNGHGTHVAGTANAVNNTRGVVGVMPGGAELFIVKIFNNSGDWVNGQSNLGAAAQACRDNGANVVSMSLGGGFSATEQTIFQQLYDTNNIVNIAAAGNGGNDVQSYPAGYPSVISVAAIDSNEVAAEFTQTPIPPASNNPANPPANVEWNATELAGGGVNVLSTWPTPNGEIPVYSVTSGGPALEAIHIDAAGTTTSAGVTGNLVNGGFCLAGSGDATWNNAIVLCERGSVSFSTKVNAAAARNARAAVIFNNAAGNFNGTCMNGTTDECASATPAVSLSQADGQALLATRLGQSTQVIAWDGTPCVGCSGGYNVISGTSMATPGVAAGVGFTWDACGGPAAITNKQLRQLLRDSAKDLTGVQQADTTPPPNGPGEDPSQTIAYGVGYDRVTGFGLVQLADALELGNARFGSACPIGLIATPAVRDVCTLNTTSTTFNLTLNNQFLGASTLSAIGAPAGSSGSFSPNPVVHPTKTSVYTLSNLGAVSAGSYAIDVRAVDNANPNNLGTAAVNLNVTTALPGVTTLSAPANGATGVATTPALSWTAVAGANSYLVQVATDAGFSNIVHSANVSGTSHTVSTALTLNTQYLWRVTPSNFCGGSTPPVRNFTTENVICRTPNVAIPDRAMGTNGVVSDTLTLPAGATLADLNVSLGITHTYVGDLLVSLRHVQTNKTVVFVDRPGVPASANGCSGNNITSILDDEAGSAVESQCAGTTPTINGTFSPNNPLSAFDSDNLGGDWILTVTDAGTGDAGTLNNWCLRPTNAAPNNAPSFSSSPVTAINEDAAYNYAITTTDPDAGATLTLTAPTLPAWLTFTPGANGAGSLSGTPSNAQVGTHNVTLRVTDGIAAPVDQAFVVTVSNTNDAPTFTSAPVTTVAEDAAYNYAITTADVDAGATRTLTAPTLPGWLTFTAGANGSGTLSGTPTNAQVGTHNVTLRVTDGIAAPVDQVFVVTVSNSNDAPTFTSAPVTGVNEDAAYNYAITTADVDAGATLTLTAPTLPGWLTFTAGANGSGTLSGTPTNAQVGAHNVTLRVTDGVAAAVDQVFVVTVSNTNDAPTFTSVAITAASEDAAYTYNITTGDVDAGATLTLTAPVGPAWLTFSPGANGAGTLAGTPTDAQLGTHNVTLRVTDGIAAPVDQVFVITVSNSNDAPTFTSAAVTAATEDAAYTYNITTADVDAGATLTLTAPVAPAWLTFTPGANGAGTLSGTPANAQVGTHNVTLRVTDGIAAPVDQVFVVTVGNTNDAPTFTSAAVTAATEGVAYSYSITTADVDAGATLTLTAPVGPAWLTFSPGANGSGTLNGIPTNAHVGTHNVTLRVSDGIAAPVDQVFVITVSNSNDAPTFTSAPVTAVNEDALYNYAIATADIDAGATLTLTAPTLPGWLTFTAGANGSGTLSGTPTNAQVGTHNVTLRVTDGIAAPVDQAFVVTVSNTSDAPTFTSAPVTAVNEGAAYNYAITTADVDAGATLTLTAPTLPGWLTFTAGVNGAGTLSGTPTQAQVGTHNVTLTVTDGTTSVDQSFTITVSNVNDAPVVANQGFSTTETASIGSAVGSIVSSDEESNTVSLAVTGGTGEALFDVATNGDITVAAALSTGSYTLNVTGTDNGTPNESDTAIVTITVTNVNDAPVVANQGFSTTETASIGSAVGSIVSSDEESNTVSFAVTGGTGEALFDVASNGDITVDAALSTGSYTLNVTGTDNGSPNESDTAIITITVTNVNDAPVVANQGFSTTETASIGSAVGSIVSSDEESDTVSFAVTGGTGEALFDVATNGDITVAAALSTGSYTLNVTGTDNGTPNESDTAIVTITVTNVNDAPVVANQGFSTTETASIGSAVGSIVSSDEESNTVSFAVTSGTGEALFDVATNGDITVAAALSTGSYTLNVTGTDNGSPNESDTAVITITVTNVNDAPVVADQGFSTTETASIGSAVGSIVSSDEEDNTVAFAVTGGTGQALFDVASNGDITVDAALTVGSYTLSVTGTDNGIPNESDTAVITITVTNVNDAPTFTSTPVTAVNEDAAYNYAIATADVDAGASLTLSAPTLPAWLTFTAGANGSGTLSGTPTNAHVGTHNVTLRVADGIAAPVDQAFVVTVSNTNDTPTFTSVPVTAVTEDVAYNYAITTADVDAGAVLTLSAPTLPNWLTFTAGANGAGTLSGTPTNAQVGTHSVTLRVSDGTAAVEQSFTITVGNTNDAPTLSASIAAQASTEGDTVSLDLADHFSDADGQALTFSTASTLPPGLSLSPAGVISGALDFASAGSYAGIVIRASDGTASVDSNAFTWTVTDVSQNQAPLVSNQAFSVSVSGANGTAVGTIASTDADVGDTRTVNVTGGTGMSVFAVSAAGAITVANSAGLTEGAIFTLNVTVTDAGGLTDTATISVTVQPARVFGNGFEGN